MTQTTYTFGTLKDAVFKALDIFSANGERVSAGFGDAADIDRRFLTALDMSMRRVSMSFPLLEKRTTLLFESGENGASAVLPPDFFKLCTFLDSRCAPKTESVYSADGRLFVPDALAGKTAEILYAYVPTGISDDTPPDTPITLPAITADALVYLTAAELCPVEESERYTRLMYKYRDIALNAYNVAHAFHGCNTFYKVGGDRKRMVK